MKDIMVKMLEQMCSQELYAAELADLNYCLYTVKRDINLMADGFNQKLPVSK